MANAARHKKNANPVKIRINEHCIIWLRGRTWQFQMYIASQRKYDRISLKTHDESVARQRAIERYGRNCCLINEGKEVFSLTLGKAADLFLEHRRKDVYIATEDPNMPLTGKIGEDRWRVIKDQLKPFLDIHGRNNSLSSISPAAGETYVKDRIQRRGRTLRISTLRNEQATINSMFRWLCQNGHTSNGQIIPWTYPLSGRLLINARCAPIWTWESPAGSDCIKINRLALQLRNAPFAQVSIECSGI